MLVLLFILSLTLGIPAVKWVFLACAVVFVGAIWVRPILETGPNTTSTVLCAVAALVVALSMFLVSNADRTTEGDDQTAGSAPTAAPASESEDDLGTQALMEEGLGTWEDTDVIQANLVTPTPDTNSATLESLSSFLFFWTINDYDSMVNYCAPSWVKSQEDSRVALFGILANRLLKSYTPGTPTGTDNDISRTVPVTAIVDKNTNDGESIFIFNIIMLKENDAWYVDPQSLKSHEEVEATTFSVIITQPPTPQPAESSMVLYYNTDGGSYYHADPYCEAVAEKYRPLTGTFTYGQINEPAYAKLKVCQRCAAPMRPSN